MSTGPRKQADTPLYVADLKGKTAIVVGANTGIGIEAAKHFAKMGVERLIITCRDEKKGAATTETIKKETGSDKVEAWTLELSSFESVKAFSEKLEKDGAKIDYFVVNAAVAHPHWHVTPDGWEETIQVNHISNALLILLLLPHLVKTAHPTRIVIVASGTHFSTTFSAERIPNGKVLATLNDKEFTEKAGTMRARYPDSKLLNVLFARALQSHLPPTSPLVITNVCPGFCWSDLRRNVEDQSMFDAWNPFARTSEEGSRQLVFAALAGEKKEDVERGEGVEKFRGAYVESGKVSSPSEWVQSEEGAKVQEEVWKETVEIAEKAAPKVKGIVAEYLKN